jgi:hypothetical protein
VAKRTVLHEIADELRQEILAVAKAVAEEIGPPADAYDGRSVSRADYIAEARAQSYADPNYVQADLDRMAPALIPMPGGVMLRSPTGVKNFIEKWHEARPDLYAHAVLEQLPPRGVDAPPPPPPPPPTSPPPAAPAPPAPPGGAGYG